jgi:serine protease DegQ
MGGILCPYAYRLWLIFTQTVTVSLAVLFVISTLRPEWLADAAGPGSRRSSPCTSHPASSGERPCQPLPGCRTPLALPSVVHIFTSKEIQVSQRHPLIDDPLFRHFFGDRFDNEPARLRPGLRRHRQPEGYILTNNHVIDGADEDRGRAQRRAQVQGEGGRLATRNPTSPCCSISGRPQTAGDHLRQSDSLRVGDVVLAIGNPFGVGQTVTMGIVSALGRSHLGINTFENFIQTDAAINPGNSGGALVDANGNLIGINTAIYSRSGGSLGIGFAIPVSLARKRHGADRQTGTVTRGWIGVEVQEITPNLPSPSAARYPAAR